MGFRLYEVERGIGVDLLRRPLFTSFVNAFMLSIFNGAFLQPNEDEEDESETQQNDGEGLVKYELIEKLAASSIYLIAHLITVAGFVETFVCVAVALIFKVLRLPRVYAFEKLLIDVQVLLCKPSVRYIKKTVRFQCHPGQVLPGLQTTRRGFGFLVITIISCEETLTREAAALLQILRYTNITTAAYWTRDSVIFVGKNCAIERALCRIGSEPARIDLGWHKDVKESTTFKMEAVFSRENRRVADSSIQLVGKRAVFVELCSEFSASALELLVKTMNQFAAVCEAYERGLRQFNGKRVSIYVVGGFISVTLIVFYEGFAGLLKPSADVLTLAIGAYTLWMTVGKSAALGETEERTTLSIVGRNNILLAYHGLAEVEPNVVNVCWIPETNREEREKVGENDAVDGSISVLEAGLCLSIFEHYGHFVKWKGPRLKLDNLEVVVGDDPNIVHVVSIRRLRNLSLLDYRREHMFRQRIGGFRYPSEVRR